MEYISRHINVHKLRKIKVKLISKGPMCSCGHGGDCYEGYYIDKNKVRTNFRYQTACLSYDSIFELDQDSDSDSDSNSDSSPESESEIYDSD